MPLFINIRSILNMPVPGFYSFGHATSTLKDMCVG